MGGPYRCIMKLRPIWGERITQIILDPPRMRKLTRVPRQRDDASLAWAPRTVADATWSDCDVTFPLVVRLVLSSSLTAAFRPPRTSSSDSSRRTFLGIAPRTRCWFVPGPRPVYGRSQLRSAAAFLHRRLVFRDFGDWRRTFFAEDGHVLQSLRQGRVSLFLSFFSYFWASQKC